MSAFASRTFPLPKDLSELILEFTEGAKPLQLAQAILKMSDFYNQNPSAPTPWSEKWCRWAQVSYFLPLNYLRSVAVHKEAEALGFSLADQPLIDFGSGLGAGSLPWAASSLSVFEKSPEAVEIHQKILKHLNLPKASVLSESELTKLGGDDKSIARSGTNTRQKFSGLFSYSLTELSHLPDWAWQTENLVIIEPSTREDGRKLLQTRQQLIEKNFSIWAPCPHQAACPLLQESKTDWCHDRIHLEMPDWFQEIEKHLPMKNKTITYSYLLASRRPAPISTYWRLVGDRLDEKGKSRQMVCRGPKREFLAWMHRNGTPPEWPRGILIEPPQQFEQKANELRLK